MRFQVLGIVFALSFFVAAFARMRVFCGPRILANAVTASDISKERTSSMAYVVCEPCHDCKYTDCVVVCPCDCFYQDGLMLYIDPLECIDCEACVPECPVDAIHHDSRVPVQWIEFIHINAERSAVLKKGGGQITEKQTPKEGPGCISKKG